MTIQKHRGLRKLAKLRLEKFASETFEKLRAQADLLPPQAPMQPPPVPPTSDKEAEIKRLREPCWRGPARHRSVLAYANEFSGLQEVGTSQ